MDTLNAGVLLTGLSLAAGALAAFVRYGERLEQARKDLAELRATDTAQAKDIGAMLGELKLRDERLAQLRKDLDDARADLRSAARAGADATGGHRPLALPRPPK